MKRPHGLDERDGAGKAADGRLPEVISQNLRKPQMCIKRNLYALGAFHCIQILFIQICICKSNDPFVWTT